MLKICERNRVNLPFGMESILHISVIDQIRQAVELDDFVDDALSLDILDRTALVLSVWCFFLQRAVLFLVLCLRPQCV